MKKNESKTEILNPTMKEISKLENDPKSPDKIEEYYEEDNPIVLKRIHRMSVKKKEIGKIRKDLMSNHPRNEEYFEETEINTDLAQKHAENYFKKRIKFFQKDRKINRENGTNASGFIPRKPLPIKNDINKNYESNNAQHYKEKERLNEPKIKENYNNSDSYKREQKLPNEDTLNKNSISKKEEKPKIESRYQRKFLNRSKNEEINNSTPLINNPSQPNLSHTNINMNKTRMPISLKNIEIPNENGKRQNTSYRSFYKRNNVITEEKKPKKEEPKNLKSAQITIDKKEGNIYQRNKRQIERLKTEENIRSRYKKEQNNQDKKDNVNKNSKITITTTTSSSNFRRRNEKK